QVLIAETISNPLLKVCDIEACVEIARENGARLIIDNTFATPYLRQPLKLGGGVLGVWDAHEILRGLKTLAVRMDRQCENARTLAGHLKEHKGIGRVHYPGIAALVSIELRDDTKE